jgi:protein ImuA
MPTLAHFPISPQPPSGQPTQSMAKGFHELLCGGTGAETTALAFAASIAARTATETGKSACLCLIDRNAQETGMPYGYGLEDFGLPPDKLLMVSAGKEKHLLWTLEEALASKAFGAVIGMLGGMERLYGFPESRRLKLRAVETGTPLYLIRHHSRGGGTAAHGRWRIATTPSRAEETHGGFKLPGAPRLRLTLEKMGGLPPQEWEMEYDGARGFRMAAVLPDRADRAADEWRQAG